MEAPPTSLPSSRKCWWKAILWGMSQGRSHHFWSGQVCIAGKSMVQLGRCGNMHPKKIFRRYDIASDIIFGPMLLRGQTTEFHTLNIYSFCPLHRTSQVLAFWMFANLASNTLHRCDLLDYHRSLVGTESCWKEDAEEFFHIVHSHLTSFNMPLVCLGALHWHLSNSVDC